MNVIRRDACQLVLVDYQARLMPAIHEADAVCARAVLLARAARILGLLVLGTQQNPDGLGPNVPAITEVCDVTLSKTHFDACADGLVDTLQQTHPQGSPPGGDVVIAGCEAHVCLLQTALGLLRAGLRVWVVGNASGSRRPSDHAAAMQRLMQAGATVVTHEMVLFEWLHDCRHPRFKDVLALIKNAG